MTARKIISVIGATGNQGAGLIDAILESKDLSSRYALRALVRDPSSSSSQSLATCGVELVRFDLHSDDVDAAAKALQGSYALYAQTFTDFGKEDEQFPQGKRLVDASLAAGVKHFVWASLPHVREVTQGRLTHLEYFENKALVERYAEEAKHSKMACSYVMAGCFMSNFISGHMLQTSHDDQADYTWSGPFHPNESHFPLVDPRIDIGKFVVGLLEAGPTESDGQRIQAVSEWISPADIVATISSLTGKKCVANRVELETFRSFLPRDFSGPFADVLCLNGEYDYYGKGSFRHQGQSDAFFYAGLGPKKSWKKYVEENLPFPFEK